MRASASPNYLKILGIVAALCLSLLQFESAFALDPKKAISQYGLDIWQDALPQSSITAIVQTRDGYLWFGTFEGLVRFDGVKFTVFDKKNTDGKLRINGLWTLCETRDGSLWIGTAGGGATRYKDGQFTAFTTNEGLPNNFVRFLYEDSTATLWFGTDGGLTKYRDGQFTTYTVNEGLANNIVRAIYEDKQGGLWVGTDGGGLSLLKNGQFTTFTEKEGLAKKTVRALYVDRAGTLWIGTNGGLNRYRDGQFQLFTTADGLSDNDVRVIFEDREGSLWIGTDGAGLNRYVNGKFTSMSSKDGLSQDSIRSIIEDREGSLWVGTNGGLNRLRDGKATAYMTQQGLSNNNVRTVFQDRAGNIWIGTDGGGLNLFKDDKFVAYTTKDGLSNNNVKSVYETRDGALWVGTNIGLNRFKDGKFTIFNTSNGLSYNNIRVIYEDRDGNLWIGTDGGGLNLYKDGKFTVYSTKEGLISNIMRAIYHDRNGDIWIGTGGGGLARLRNGQLTNFTIKDGLANNVVFVIYEDRDGNLWIGTSGGINRYRDGKFVTITSKEGLFDDVAFQILEDDSDNFWISCNKGIFRVSRKELIDVAEGRATSVQSTVFGKADGMGASQCNGASQPAGWRSTDGKLWFPTVKGVTIIEPRNIRTNKLPPLVPIEKVVVDNESIAFASRVTLAPGKEKFEFHYAGLSFLSPDKVKFKYILEGFDREWVDAGTRRVAYYTNLPPGNYTFRVMACNNDGIWSEQASVFSFYLKTPPWKTWWAYLIYIGTVLGLGYGGVRYRIETLRRRNEELEVKVQQRTAELDEKVKQLAKKNEELIQSQRQADRIFNALADVLPGTILENKYCLESKIGGGGFGAVYRAMHLGIQKPVAVKILRPALGNASSQYLERFRLEGISTCRVNHPNAVTVLDSGISQEGIAYLVMELLEGRTLTDELNEKGHLLPTRCAEIIVPVCDVLQEAHDLGIVHRDIKPDNIFLHNLKGSEIIKVVDFGIAKLVSDIESPDKNQTVGGVLGTPTYIAPERFDDQPYDGRSDVYSVGVMLYQMLTGRVPFQSSDGTLFTVAFMHISQAPKPLREINPNITPEIENVVLRALAKDPAARPSAAELARLFLTAVGIQAKLHASGQLKIILDWQSDNNSDAISQDTVALPMNTTATNPKPITEQIKKE